ncbi:protein of unknown function DUF214 [Desulfofarcimen acetoxidans DSM 771]|uniref:ABC3 transporter permease protein domain-containing protein n=1 Tax=Desulfofarcimen acetoxidans (strain ATCC 49208 / DSM 771 / KCTC 5769 / VKM B-1644 / 5575) TaxID=485916 RepID=C8VYQ4_DESAS|nr:ABC transporter permease [Desulfofarcimen acetoxidans]ACV64775.1 protein of unknown function DUF214 [Desulfofarcimen acetoxidans DSM 771]
MKLFVNFRQAVRGIFKKKVRAFLAMLGISTSIASIILLLSLGQGVQEKVSSQFEALGANQLIIIPMRTLKTTSNQPDFLRGLPTFTGTLSLEDIDAIQKVPDVAVAAPQSENVLTVVRPGGINSADTLITGVTPEYFTLAKLNLSAGQFFTSADETSQNVVLGSAVKETLFGEENALGQQIIIRNKRFNVAGVLEPKESIGFSFNERVYLPIEKAQSITGLDKLSLILVQAKSNDVVDRCKDKIGSALRPLHKTTDYSILKQGEMLSMIDKFSAVLTAMLTGITGITLVISAIGITNVMLLTAIERTREIGIRKVLGATTFDIFIQFVFEAVLIAALAGLIGIAAGYGFIKILSHYLPSLPFKITWLSIARTGLAATTAGIIFGLYPAVRAALLQPARAIRHK